jgi:isopropylmalate/homocitrate/citramalate synthase
MPVTVCDVGPFEGKVDPERVVGIAADLTGADELVLADTIGVATPTQVKRLVERVTGLGRPVGAHLHNTRNTGFANAYAALEAGAHILDASVGGLGGCPFAPRATGDVATEDLVYLLDSEGIESGVDLEALIDVAK